MRITFQLLRKLIFTLNLYFSAALGTQTRQKSVGRAAFLQKLEKNSSHNQVPGKINH